MPEEIIYREGQRFQFVITNKLVLPGTDEANFILLGPDQKKYLLPELFYENYHLKIGQTIICTIDKINCSGKIFLEPDHPYYKLGERYDFLVLRLAEQENFLGKTQLIAWVRDLHGLEWSCPIDKDDDIEPGYSYLACRVDRIKKGELILSLPAMTSRFTSLKAGNIYTFKLLDIKTFENDQFYVFKDTIGNFHRLPVTYYMHYGFRPGQNIEAMVVKYKPNGECLIEPLHPFYKIGEFYSFKYTGMRKSVDLFGRIEAVIVLSDVFGEEIKVKPHTWQIHSENYSPETITCLVQSFRKGRPVLLNIEKENMEPLTD
jgi:hypothetical protein